MEKEELFQVESNFYKKLEKATDTKEKFELFERYYDWIKSIECPRDLTDETSNACLRMEGKCIDQLCKWLSKTNTRAKDLTSNWNGMLVKKVATYVEYYEAKVKTNQEPISISKSAVVFKAVWEEKDFATKAYCWQLLQRANLEYKTFGEPNKKKIAITETEIVD